MFVLYYYSRLEEIACPAWKEIGKKIENVPVAQLV